jgi:hypothetical protein
LLDVLEHSAPRVGVQGQQGRNASAQRRELGIVEPSRTGRAGESIRIGAAHSTPPNGSTIWIMRARQRQRQHTTSAIKLERGRKRRAVT